MRHTNSTQVALLTMIGVLAACSLLTYCGLISKLAVIISVCANIRGLEYIIIVAFIGLLPAFFKAVHNDTHNRRLMKFS